MKSFLLGLTMLLAVGSAWAQTRSVTGTVTDAEDGLGVPGVNVVVQGTNRGTTTDVNGAYSIELGTGENALVFSFVGYATQTIEVGDRSTLDVALTADVKSLEEVVVIGYGVARKSDLTGSVVTVQADELQRIASANASEALQGKVAGVQVTTNGVPGSAPTVRIRGLGSVSSRVDPLYVVDGVLVDDISFLGSNDIESMNILKDASASAIYGTRAANGVVIITTKKGTRDQTRISYAGYGGIQTPINLLEMANGQQYIQLLNEKDEISASRTGSAFTPRNPANYPVSTDWYDEVLRDAGSIQSHDIGVSGGGDQFIYALGASYFKQEGIARKTDYDRVNIRTNIEADVTDFLKVGLTGTLSNTSSTNTPPQLFRSAFIAPPAVSVRVDENTFSSMQEFGDFGNPAATSYYYNNETRGTRLVGGVFGEVYLSKALTFKSYYGVDASTERNRDYVPRYFVSTAQRDTTQTLSITNRNFFSSYWDNTLTYTQTFAERHNLTVLAGMSAQEQRFYSVTASRQGVEDFGESSWYLNKGSQDGQSVTDDGTRLTSISYFGRINYNYDEKYLFTATLRRDGTSIFPENNRFDYFPSIGVGWVLSNESFMQDQGLFQYLKFRASWGEMGNNRIPPNTAVRSVSTGGDYSVIFGNGSVQNGASITVIAPENLLWEVTQEADVALEGNMLNNRLNFELDFYHRKTLNAIFPVTTNGTLGASNTSYLDNNADIVNRGVELSLGYNNEEGEFKYSIGGNVAFNQNEVVALKPGTVGIYGGFINVTPTTYTTVGHSIGEFYGRRVIGIFQSEEEVNNYTGSGGEAIQPNAKPGDFKYEDVNGDGVVNDKDRVFLGSAVPKYNYGITLSGQYKGFDLAIDLYGQGGNKIYNAKRYRQIGNENYDLDFYNNRWNGPGSSNSYPSADLSADANKQANSWYLESGNFFKIRNIQLGYTVAEEATSRIGISRLRVYVSATNPFVFFEANSFSPEIPTPASTINDPNTGALLSQGLDNNVYPMVATYNLGVNVQL